MSDFIKQKVLEVLNKSRLEPSRLEMKEIADRIISMPSEAFRGQELPSKVKIGKAIQEMIDDGTLSILRDWTVVINAKENPEPNKQDS